MTTHDGGFRPDTVEAVAALPPGAVAQFLKWCIANHVSAPQAADMLGVTKQAIYGWIRNKRTPRSSRVVSKMRELSAPTKM